MSVYTTVSHEEAESWLSRYSLGTLVELKGIPAGITNTNYFLTTTEGKFVLTVFEALTLEEVPYYLHLMDFLASHNIACPAPVKDKTHTFSSLLAGKPAALVTRLAGQDVAYPNNKQCYNTGKMLARLHNVSSYFKHNMANPRGTHWWNKAAPSLYAQLDPSTAEDLRQEILFLNTQTLSHLPTGVIHADLFRDNVLMLNNEVTGFIDFYYACNDFFVYDMAIAVNDWAMTADGILDDNLASAFLQGYQDTRRLTLEEQRAWPIMLRAAALRFWVSRLWDYYYPTSGELTYAKDPAVFHQILLSHRERKNLWLNNIY